MWWVVIGGWGGGREGEVVRVWFLLGVRRGEVRWRGKGVELVQ